MSWVEVRTRLHQELGKRLDAALYRVGVQPRALGFGVGSGPRGRFFFSADELPERVKLLQQHLPFEMEAIIREADQICCHRFQLLGYNDLVYSKEKEEEIDWHLDAVHGKRTPLIPWYKIDFLDFAESGDHKVIWELNRHQHLVTLAKAWLLTREEKYASEAISQWYSWQRANPYPLGVNWASSLEVAFRSLSWLWLWHLLEDWPVLPAGFLNDLQYGLALNGRHIERNLSTYFSPNTHLLGEAVALFFMGTLVPQLLSAQRWKKQSWRILEEQAQRQVRADGVYFEQSLYYHVYALDFFLHARVLASRNGVEISSRFDNVIRKMLAVVEALAEVSLPDGFGDDDGGRLFNPRRNRTEHMTDPLAVGAALFNDGNLGSSAGVTEEAIWLLGSEAARHLCSSPVAALRPRSCSFPDGGLYIAADENPIPQQIVIDGGPQGMDRSGHGHADALSLKLTFGKRRWLVDAGTFCYIAPGDERQRFRGTRAHNTLAVDGLDQANPEGPFAWSALPVSQVELWISGATFTFFAGSHSGYERLAEPVRHRRFVFHPHGGFWLVREVAEGRGVHLLETSWHFAPDLGIAAKENSFGANTFVASPRTSDESALASLLMLIPAPDPQWKCELVSEFVSPVYGRQVPAAVLRCSARVAAPAEHAVLLVPSVHRGEATGNFFRAAEPELQKLSVYCYDSALASHTMVFAQAKSAAWTFGPWSSDASFLYSCVEDQRVTHLVCCEGSFVQLQSKQVFSCSAPLQYLEWTNRNGQRRMHSSNEAVSRSFSQSTLEASILV